MFAPGHHLYRSPDGSWRYSAPGDVFVRIGGADHLLTLVQQIEAGIEVTVPEADRAALARVRAALTERGVLAGQDRAGRNPAGQDPIGQELADWTVHIEDDSPVAGALLELLGGVRATVGRVDEGVVASSDVVVSCAQWLPDSRWRQLDSWCTAHATPWHGCYSEGDTFVLGPLSIPGRTASYRDTRGRRLAAAALPDELTAYWAYLDSDAARPPARFSPAAISVLAGLLAADLLALMAGRVVPSEGHQLVINLATTSIRRHPVLRLPDLAAEVGGVPELAVNPA